MKIKMFVYLKGFKNKINREIIVSEDMNLMRFCESVILAMNGNLEHLYQLIVNEEIAVLGPGNFPHPFYEERLIEEDETVGDWYLDVGDKLMLNYDFAKDWEMYMEVKEVFEDDKNCDFEVIGGKGNGIIEDLNFLFSLKDLIDCKSAEEMAFRCNVIDGYKEYISNTFDAKKINLKIDKHLNTFK